MGKSSHFSLSRMARSWHRAHSNSNSNSNSGSIAPLHVQQVGAFQESKGVSLKKEETTAKECAEEHQKALAQATVPIEIRLSNGERLWDQEFSSMSSCMSHDLELLHSCGKLESFEYGSELDIHHLDQPSSSSLRSETCVSALYSSCSSFNSDRASSAPDDLVTSKRSKLRRQRSSGSLSAELPADVSGPTKNSIPLVMQSYDPYGDFRNSIRQMVHENGIYEWQELQELVYCYITLNSEEMHEWIKAAFVDVLVELKYVENEESYDWP